MGGEKRTRRVISTIADGRYLTDITSCNASSKSASTHHKTRILTRIQASHMMQDALQRTRLELKFYGQSKTCMDYLRILNLECIFEAPQLCSSAEGI